MDTDAPHGFSLAVDLVVMTVADGQLKVLLTKRASEPFVGRWALPGAIVDIDQSLDDAVRGSFGEILETLAMRSGHLEQLFTMGETTRDPRGRVISVSYFAVARQLSVEFEHTGAYPHLRFFDVEELTREGEDILAFDHAKVVEMGVERVRAKLEYTTLATTFVAEQFTIAELRKVYESVWGFPLHPARFRKHVLSAGGLVAPASGGGGAGRPDLYEKGPAEVIYPALLRDAYGMAMEDQLRLSSEIEE